MALNVTFIDICCSGGQIRLDSNNTKLFGPVASFPLKEQQACGLFNGGCLFNTEEEPDQQHAAARGAPSCLPAFASAGPEISGACLSPVEGGGGGTGSVVRVCERPEATISLSMEIIDALLKCSFPLKPKPSFRHIVTNNSEAIVQ